MTRRPITIGVAQSRNSPDVREDGREVRQLAQQARSDGAAIVQFPEGGISGCSNAKIKLLCRGRTECGPDTSWSRSRTPPKDYVPSGSRGVMEANRRGAISPRRIAKGGAADGGRGIRRVGAVKRGPRPCVRAARRERRGLRDAS